MSKADDVSTLFRRFGGDASTYQEVVAEQQVESAMSRWPMLDQISPLLRPASHAGSANLAAGGVRAHHVVPEAVVPTAAVSRPVVDHSVSAPLVAAPTAVVQREPVRAVAASPSMAPLVQVRQQVPVVAPTQVPKPLSKLFAQVVPVQSAVSEPVAGSGLQSMFKRMVPSKPAPAAAPADSGLKRLAKW